MENDFNKKPELKDFTSEYFEIIKNVDKAVVVETQWEKDGDFFQQISMYDSSYIPVKTLGSTTLIQKP